jgi:hypothetical protein
MSSISNALSEFFTENEIQNFQNLLNEDKINRIKKKYVKNIIESFTNVDFTTPPESFQKPLRSIIHTNFERLEDTFKNLLIEEQSISDEKDLRIKKLENENKRLRDERDNTEEKYNRVCKEYFDTHFSKKRKKNNE